jgi:branched-chain amino acid transport system permease protein
VSATETSPRTVSDDRRAQWKRLESWLSGSDPRPLAPPVYRGRQWAYLLFVAVLACFVPTLFGGDPYHDGLLDTTMVDAILALGFYWCFSLAGQFTFAVVAVYATGSYVSLWAARHIGGFWVGFIAAMIVAGILGGAMRLLFIRLSALYFAIATFGVSGLLLILYQNWTQFTGGYQGIAKIPKPTLFGYPINTLHRQYYLMLAVLVVFLGATIALLRSPAMRDLTLSRDKSPVAATAGLKPQHLMLVAFVVGSAMQGAAGSLFAHNVTFVSLESFDPTISLTVLLMVLLGGMESIYGPVIGAAIIVYLPEILRSWQKYADLIYAGLVLLIIIAFPTGVAGTRTIIGRWMRRAGSR